jgi:hypothetical protein
MKTSYPATPSVKGRGACQDQDRSAIFLLTFRSSLVATGKVMPLSRFLEKADFCKLLLLLVPKEGVEPSWYRVPRDFESEPARPQIAVNA